MASNCVESVVSMVLIYFGLLSTECVTSIIIFIAAIHWDLTVICPNSVTLMYVFSGKFIPLPVVNYTLLGHMLFKK